MWRKQEQPKSNAPVPEVAATTALGTPAADVSSSAPNGSASGYKAPSAVEAAPPVAPKPVSTPVPHVSTAGSRLTGTLRVKGEITGKEDLLIDAQMDGQVRLDVGTITVGPNGRVSANLDAAEIVVTGQIKGSLHGRDRVRISPTGKTSGEIVSNRISIEAGADVTGRVEVTRAEDLVKPRVAAAANAQGSAPRPAQPAQPVTPPVPPVKGPTAAA